MSDYPVYYRIMFWDKIQKLTVVCMQEFDEPDYDPNKFLKDQHGQSMSWNTEEQALTYLNNTFKHENIDPKCITANNPDFRKDYVPPEDARFGF